LCCGDDANGDEKLTTYASSKRRPAQEFSEEDEFIAAGIYRGEGSTYCLLGRRKTEYGRHPELVAAIAMCDRDSIQIVARVFGSKVYHNRGGKRAGGTDAWQTRIFGVNRVKGGIGEWVA
jgi:hypothetical protein